MLITASGVYQLFINFIASMHTNLCEKYFVLHILTTANITYFKIIGSVWNQFSKVYLGSMATAVLIG
jgi:hypothetical protein